MKRALLLFIGLSLPSIARGHDFWIEPSSFHPAVGETVSLGLRVGQDFLGDPVARSQSLIDTFVARDAKAEHPVGGFENQDPAGYIKVERSGVTSVGYRSRRILEAPGREIQSVSEGRRPRRRRASSREARRDGEARPGAVLPLCKDASAHRHGLLAGKQPRAWIPLRDRATVGSVVGITAACPSPVRREAARRGARHGNSSRRSKGADVGPIRRAGPRDTQLAASRGVDDQVGAHDRGARGTDADWESSWASLTFER